LVLGNGKVEEVGTFEQLSSDPKSRFSAFLKTMAESSKATIEEAPATAMDSEESSSGDDDRDGISIDAIKIIHTNNNNNKSPRRPSMAKQLSISRLSIVGTSPGGTDEAMKEEEESSINANNGALMTDEFKERVKGSVDRAVYIAWAKSAGGISVGVLILAMFVGVEGLNVMSKWWLTYWSSGSGGRGPFFYLGIYALVNVSAMWATFFRLLLFVYAGLRASRSMFERLLDVVLAAPMSFFDT